MFHLNCITNNKFIFGPVYIIVNGGFLYKVIDVFFWNCYTIISEKGESWYLFKRLNPLQLFAPVLSQECDIQWLSFVDVVHKCLSLLVFLYRLDPLFFRLNGFTLVMFCALYGLLFGVSHVSVLKTVLWPIMVNLNKVWLGWRVISLALISHLLISIWWILVLSAIIKHSFWSSSVLVLIDKVTKTQ